MDADAPLDYALFQLSPRRSRCELFVSGRGRTEKIASGFLKPFITHLKVAEEQSLQPSIRLQLDRRGNGAPWFNKGTLERFVRFVSTPEVMELANTLDAEMSQLEGARRIYSQGTEDLSSGAGKNETTSATSADITKKELLKAIDVRLMAVKQDLTTACARAASAGFVLETVSDLLYFSNQFGAHRLNEACTKFISLCERRPDLIAKHQPTQSQWKESNDANLRASTNSDMSIDEPEPQNQESDPVQIQHSKPVTQQPEEREKQPNQVEPHQTGTAGTSTSTSTGTSATSAGTRRLSVQDRISMFEKQASMEKSTVVSPIVSSVAAAAAAKGTVSGTKPEHRRVPSNTSMERSVLRRWSGASDMSIDLSTSVNSVNSDTCDNRKDNNNTPAGTPTSELRPISNTAFNPRVEEDVTSKASISETVNPNNTKPKDCADEKEHSIPKEVQSTAPVIQFKASRKLNVGTDIVPVCEAEQVVVKDIEVATVSVSPIMPRHQEKKIPSKFMDAPSDNVRVRDSNLNGVSGTKTEDSDNKKSRVSATRTRAVQRKSAEVVPQQHLGDKIARESNYDVGSEARMASKNDIKRQPIGNNELQMKADELEKLFAAHKLRVQTDNVPSARRNPKPPKDNEAVKETIPTKPFDFNTTTALLKKMVESPDGGAHSLPEELRGKFYEKYTVKREAKLKAEWRSKQPEKEASLRAMQDSLEKSRAEMKIRFSHSEPARIRVSRKMSFGSHSELRDKDQVTKFLVEDDDEDHSHSDNLSADGSSVSADSRKHASSRSLSNSNSNSNSNPRGLSAASSIPRSSSRSTTAASNSVHRRTPPDNMLAQSVPNFTELRKENTRPSVISSRGGNNNNNQRAQVSKSFARSKSITGETATNNSTTPVKEDISRRTQSMRKCMVSPVTSTNELKDVSTLGDDANNADFGFEPLKTGLPDSFQSYSYDMEGNGLIPQPVLFHDPIKDQNEDFDTESLEEEVTDTNPIGDFSDNENPNAENMHRSQHNFPQLAQFFPYQYQNETSDNDTFSESPMGSPGSSWNSMQVRKKWGAAQAPNIGGGGAHMLGRKDNNNMAKGFKRLLKFGRKSRGGIDGANDWVSAASTTSEGDDDILEGGEMGAAFGGEEFKRSNLGYPLASSYDGFGESDVFGEQVQTMRGSIPNVPTSFKLHEDQLSGSALKAPRSFFSLSSFRSKGAESKLR